VPLHLLPARSRVASFFPRPILVHALIPIPSQDWLLHRDILKAVQDGGEVYPDDNDDGEEGSQGAAPGLKFVPAARGELRFDQFGFGRKVLEKRRQEVSTPRILFITWIFGSDNAADCLKSFRAIGHMLTLEPISNPCSTGYTRRKEEKEVMAVHAQLYGMEC
jgi:hypothetical protein